VQFSGPQGLIEQIRVDQCFKNSVGEGFVVHGRTDGLKLKYKRDR
jgi:hypothetical protein